MRWVLHNNNKQKCIKKFILISSLLLIISVSSVLSNGFIIHALASQPRQRANGIVQCKSFTKLSTLLELFCYATTEEFLCLTCLFHLTFFVYSSGAQRVERRTTRLLCKILNGGTKTSLLSPSSPVLCMRKQSVNRSQMAEKVKQEDCEVNWMEGKFTYCTRLAEEEELTLVRSYSRERSPWIFFWINK